MSHRPPCRQSASPLIIVVPLPSPSWRLSPPPCNLPHPFSLSSSFPFLPSLPSLPIFPCLPSLPSLLTLPFLSSQLFIPTLSPPCLLSTPCPLSSLSLSPLRAISSSPSLYPYLPLLHSLPSQSSLPLIFQTPLFCHFSPHYYSPP
ncbi:unnamed protein product [Closterium sp. Naga37s-1]|nr:unnamed protein product [Closterium sp. Naga37s-1]